MQGDRLDTVAGHGFCIWVNIEPEMWPRQEEEVLAFTNIEYCAPIVMQEVLLQLGHISS